jgi:hypothetical protein
VGSTIPITPVNSRLVPAAQAWSNILDLLAHCTTCVATNCHYVRTDAYISALSYGLENGSLWANCLIQMRELAKEKFPSDPSKTEARTSRLRAWYSLGKEIGLTARLPLASPTYSARVAGDAAGKVRIRNAVDGCWWEQCGRHGSADKELELTLSRCSRCKAARYCSSDCQKADWTVHKPECRMLKGATDNQGRPIG